MNQYITTAEYRNRGGVIPESVSDDELNRFLQLASAKIDLLTFGRIQGDLDNVTAFQADLVQQATVYQTDILYEVQASSGTLETGGVASWSVTDISMSYTNSTGSDQWKRTNNVSSLAYELLDLSGLMWRGV